MAVEDDVYLRSQQEIKINPLLLSTEMIIDK